PDIPNYAQVTTHNAYPGVDVAYFGNTQGNLEYDLIVAPGADYHQIRMTIQGARTAQVDSQGNLLMTTAGGQLVQQAPALYQLVNGTKRPVTGNYVLTGGTQVTFAVGAYDATKPLYIDPAFAFSTYLGGSVADKGLAIAVNGEGESYVTGSTTSASFPKLNPF